MIRKISLIIIAIVSCILIVLLGNMIYKNHIKDNNNNLENEIDNTVKEKNENKDDKDAEKVTELLDNIIKEEVSSIKDVSDINLHDIDGKGMNYSFTYREENYSAIYTKDNWKIVDSYKITNKSDMSIIVKGLIDIYPIHGKDMVSFRTVDDLVYEWTQHNIAYSLLTNDNPWKKNTKDVDLNPADQGLSLEEMYESRTGKKFDIKDFSSNK